MSTSFQLGGNSNVNAMTDFANTQTKIFHSQRNSKSHQKPGRKGGAVAMDLVEDMKKFKTWQKFNKEFERRLTKKE